MTIIPVNSLTIEKEIFIKENDFCEFEILSENYGFKPLTLKIIFNDTKIDCEIIKVKSNNATVFVGQSVKMFNEFQNIENWPVFGYTPSKALKLTMKNYDNIVHCLKFMISGYACNSAYIGMSVVPPEQT